MRLIFLICTLVIFISGCSMKGGFASSKEEAKEHAMYMLGELIPEFRIETGARYETANDKYKSRHEGCVTAVEGKDCAKMVKEQAERLANTKD